MDEGLPETWANQIMKNPVLDFEEMIKKLERSISGQHSIEINGIYKQISGT